jgi:hypothetical protein
MLIRRSCFTSTALSIILAAASSSISWKRTFVLYSRSIPIALVVHNGFYQTTHCTYFDLTFTLSFTKAFSHTPMSLSQLTSSNIPSQPDSSRNRPNNNNPETATSLFVTPFANFQAKNLNEFNPWKVKIQATPNLTADLTIQGKEPNDAAIAPAERSRSNPRCVEER